MTIDINAIINQVNGFNNKKLPPIHDWAPKNIYDIDIVINDNACWFHEGQPIERQSLVKLFSSILIKEDNEYFLITPVEKCRITVEDVPFLVTYQVDKTADTPAFFVTNTEDVIAINENTQCLLKPFNEQNTPYLRVRDNLFARVSRSLYYQMLEEAELRSEKGGTSFYFNKGAQELLIGRIESE